VTGETERPAADLVVDPEAELPAEPDDDPDDDPEGEVVF
jgi:hypothetical protein